MDSQPHLSEDPRMLAWRAFLQAHSAVVARLEHELEVETELSLSQYEVLLHLRFAPEGRMRMQELAGSVLLSKSGVTRLVDRMAVAGLVERAACESDRRVTYAGITEEGRRALREADPVHLRGIEEHFARFLTPEEAGTMAALLLKIFRNAVDTSGMPQRVVAEPVPEPA
jgi:DNA-binding MarR family transcriptional regulator